MFREGAAKRFEHADRRRPVLQPDQRGACVVLGRRTDSGRRRCRANPQEVVGGRPIVLRLVCALTLFVDRGGEVVHERCARLVVLRRDCEHLGVGALGLRILLEFERTVRNDNPGGAPDGRVRAWIRIDDSLGGVDGGAVVLHLVHVIGGRSQDRRGVFVFRKCVGKFERACDRLALDGILLLARVLQQFTVCVNSGVACVCRLRVRWVSVSRALILLGRLAKILVLPEQVRKLVVDRRRIGILRERLQIAVVPSDCLSIICQLLSRFLRALILGVIMGGEVLQVRLQVGQHLW